MATPSTHDQRETRRSKRLMNEDALEVAENLKNARNAYTKKHRASDPLLEVLGQSPSPVVSHAVQRGKQVSVSPEPESPSECNPSPAKKKTPVKKKAGIIATRESAQQV